MAELRGPPVVPDCSCRWKLLAHSLLYIGRLHLFWVSALQWGLTEQKVIVQPASGGDAAYIRPLDWLFRGDRKGLRKGTIFYNRKLRDAGGKRNMSSRGINESVRYQM